mmetsp:Transcript_14952/g.28139  ORF Transcript_14952/g.28139 Transcript_14952/m.28139 type:complete len:178 (-) Transcript_14952:793-1326(-)
MGAVAVAELAVVYGVIISEPKEPNKKKAKEEEDESQGKKVAKSSTKDEHDEEMWWWTENEDEKVTFKQSFQAAHRTAFGTSTGVGTTGLRLCIIRGLETRNGVDEEIFVIEHSPSRVYRECLKSGHAEFVSLESLGDPGEKVRSGIHKLLEEGYGMDPKCCKAGPGWLALAACTFYE